MMNKKNRLRNSRQYGCTQSRRLMIAIHESLLSELRDCADDNHVSVSHFVRESISRNIRAYQTGGANG